MIRPSSPPWYSNRRPVLLIACGLMIALAFPATPSLGAVDNRDRRNEVGSSGEGTGEVRGRVRSGETGRFLHKAQILVAGSNRRVETNEFGEYRVVLPAGPNALRFSYTSLEAQALTVAVRTNELTRLDVVLLGKRDASTEETVAMSAFLVVATEQSADSIAINEQRYSTTFKNVVDAGAYGDVTEGNLGEFIKYLPGLNVDYGASDVRNVTLRGFQANFVPVTFDGNRLASAGGGRGVGFEQISMNNIARVEVVKVPTPDLPADSLGGSVNLISKSAFERASRQIDFRVFFNGNREEFTLGRTPGPMGSPTYKLQPGFDLTYAQPVSARFGFVFTVAHSKQFTELLRTRTQWNFDNAPLTPYARAHQQHDSPNFRQRQTLSLNTDFKATDNTVVSTLLQYNPFLGYYGNRELNMNTGSTPASFTPTSTQGRAGAGSVTRNTFWERKFGAALNASVTVKHIGVDFKVEGNAYYSESTEYHRDRSDGYFRQVTLNLPSVTVRYDGVGDFKIAQRTVTAANGRVIDFSDLGEYQFQRVVSKAGDLKADLRGLRLDGEKSYSRGPLPVTFRTGGAIREQVFDRNNPEPTWNFVGRDGRAGTADDNASILFDPSYSYAPQGYGYQRVQWQNPMIAGQLFREHPEYFSLDEAGAIQKEAEGNTAAKERVSAAYLMGSTKLLAGRLTLMGGSRFEHTKFTGTSYLYDAEAIYQRGANGAFELDAAGRRVLKPEAATTAAQRRLQYKIRGNTSSRSYQDYYPGAHAIFTFAEPLQARLSYARTLGRPSFDNLYPGLKINEGTSTNDAMVGTIQQNNPGLRPWEADNYDASLEYYFKNAGMISVAWFQKNVSGFFTGTIQRITPDIAQQLNLDARYVGWLLDTFRNGGDARIRGVEVNVVRPLGFLGPWAKPVSVFANGTLLKLGGPSQADFREFVDRTANWGVSYENRRASLRLRWNYNGERRRSPSTPPADAYSYRRSRLMLDVNAEYRFSRRIGLFTNIRNITNEGHRNGTWNSTTPAYARDDFQEEFGVNFSAGVKGSF
jgi:TonB-dependent receptor